MLLPLTAIATAFVGVWILTLAIEFKIRPMSKRRQEPAIALPKSQVSLISLILFLFTPTPFVSPFHSLKLESEFHRSTD